jgi:hypothetical protein
MVVALDSAASAVSRQLGHLLVQVRDIQWR